jgi:hypothetical protein
MNFSNGMTFDLNVETSDTVTATSFSSLAKTGMVYRKITASPVEQVPLANTMIGSSQDMLQLHLGADDQCFEALN